MLLAFSIELILMAGVSTQRKRYLAHNWLSLAIIAATAVSLLLPHVPGELYALLRLLRLVLAGFLGARLAHQLRSLTPGSTPYILLLGIGLMLLSGVGFYWLEPTVSGYWDGVWLAFTSGLTVGYGDLVPTTYPARLFVGVVIVLTYGVMSLVTASIAAFFIGQEERHMRLEMHHDLKALRNELADLRDLISAQQSKLPVNMKKQDWGHLAPSPARFAKMRVFAFRTPPCLLPCPFPRPTPTCGRQFKKKTSASRITSN